MYWSRYMWLYAIVDERSCRAETTFSTTSHQHMVEYFRLSLARSCRSEHGEYSNVSNTRKHHFAANSVNGAVHLGLSD